MADHLNARGRVRRIYPQLVEAERQRLRGACSNYERAFFCGRSARCVLGAGARGASLLTVPSTTELVTIKKSEAEIANASTVAASNITTRRKPAATTATASIEAFRVRDQGRRGETAVKAA